MSLNENLFHALHDATLKELQTGSGDETGQTNKGKKRAKMLSLRSSSVLVANVFDHWRTRDFAVLAGALGAEGSYTGLKFEQPFDHGLSTGKPHLDVVLYAADDRQPFAIEAKFAEPYSVAKEHQTRPIAEKYFSNSLKRWTAVGLPRCQKLAAALGHDKFFHHLDAVQLLKHVLGLAHDPAGHAGPTRNTTLLYLWFDTRCPEAELHCNEIEDFKSRLDAHLDFRSLTYQALFRRLDNMGSSDYIEYLRRRYFSPAYEVHPI